MKRRDFLKLCGAVGLLAGCDRFGRGERIGVALGGGGARGLSHILMLEVFDELGITPHRIAGTSIGAVIGTLYAAGLPGAAIRERVDRLTVSPEESWLSSLFKEDVGRWWDFIQLRLGSGGLVDADVFARYIQETAGVARFDQLRIPMKVVAADFWRNEQVVFEKGELQPAIQATIAIPGLFTPVRHDGRVLVDGGLVNPVPYDLLFDECDRVIAIDVSGLRTPTSDNGPTYFETVFNTMQIMQASIVREKMRYRAPDLYIHPALENIRVLEFNRVEEIYEQSMPAVRTLRRALD